jgi:hypothetical protein
MRFRDTMRISARQANMRHSPVTVYAPDGHVSQQEIYPTSGRAKLAPKHPKMPITEPIDFGDSWQESCDTCVYQPDCQITGDLVRWCKAYAEEGD